MKKKKKKDKQDTQLDIGHRSRMFDQHALFRLIVDIIIHTSIGTNGRCRHFSPALEKRMVMKATRDRLGISLLSMNQFAETI